MSLLTKTGIITLVVVSAASAASAQSASRQIVVESAQPKAPAVVAQTISSQSKVAEPTQEPGQVVGDKAAEAPPAAKAEPKDVAPVATVPAKPVVPVKRVHRFANDFAHAPQRVRYADDCEGGPRVSYRGYGYHRGY